MSDVPGSVPVLPPEISPERYIEKVSLRTGEVLDEPILPKQLLANSHRDYHVVDVHARYMMSRVVKATGDEEAARTKMREMRALGQRTAERLAKMIGEKDPEKISKALFGLKSKEYYFRYKGHQLSSEEIDAKLDGLRRLTREKLEATAIDGEPQTRVLLTGGTGFVGKEILWQVAQDPTIVEIVTLIRPKVIRDRKTKEIVQTLTPAERGEALLRQLWLDTPELRSKYRFVAGDIEEPNLGISDDELADLSQRITHVIHCAASVAFDDPYEQSFGANVSGTLNALGFSLGLQETEGSPFVAHLGIETSYIHGRQTSSRALEDEIVFPRNFYNNYYELTKAMASIETDRFMLEKGLRVVQLCPAIVIGEARTGNNRGDTKVVNAPVNVFGRAHQTLKGPKAENSSWIDRSKASAIARLACVFPGDPSAEINLIPVDRVVDGIVAALKKPNAVGERIHLATDNRVTSRKIQEIVRDEIGADVRLAEPTLHRTVTLPLLTKTLSRLKQERIAKALEKLGTIFGGYAEWGQPIHAVGNDIEVLGLSAERPNSEHCFRMLCRHNRYVQEFGAVKDADEISRRERIWQSLMVELEEEAGGPAGAIEPKRFHDRVRQTIDLESFTRRA